MNNNSDNRKIEVLFKTGKLQLLCWIVLIFASTQNSFAEKTRNHPYTKALVEKTQVKGGVESPNLVEFAGFSMEENDIIIISNVKGGLALDSIMEEDYYGIYLEYKRCKFFYNESKKLTKSICRYNNGNFEFKNITETRTYDEVGHEVKLVIHQPDNSYPYRWDYDTTAIDLYTEENKYENGKIVQKDIVNLAQRDDDNPTRQVKYFYNEKGQLTSRTETSVPDGLIWEAQYYYNKDGEIEIKVEPITVSTPDYYYVEKKQYQYSDSVYVITKSLGYFNGQLQKSDLDTISIWYYIYTFNERYDSVNRSLSISSHYLAHFEKKDQPYFNAEYGFTESGELSYAYFSQWIGNADSGYYKETTRIENLYDEFGNLQQHLETFYDDRFSDWSIKEKKTYYYSSTNKSTGRNNEKNLPCRIFPNPATDFISISNLHENNCGYKLYDMQCRLVGSGTVARNVIDISELKAGIYIVKIHDFTARFVKY